MQPNRSPVLGAHQAHLFRVLDRSAAAVADLPEAGTVPQLDGVLMRELPRPEPLSDAELSGASVLHALSFTQLRLREKSRVAYSSHRREGSMDSLIFAEENPIVVSEPLNDPPAS